MAGTNHDIKSQSWTGYQRMNYILKDTLHTIYSHHIKYGTFKFTGMYISNENLHKLIQSHDESIPK